MVHKQYFSTLTFLFFITSFRMLKIVSDNFFVIFFFLKTVGQTVFQISMWQKELWESCPVLSYGFEWDFLEGWQGLYKKVLRTETSFSENHWETAFVWYSLSSFWRNFFDFFLNLPFLNLTKIGFIQTHIHLGNSRLMVIDHKA